MKVILFYVSPLAYTIVKRKKIKSKDLDLDSP